MTRPLGVPEMKGASKAKYSHLLFIDCDIFLPSNFLNDFFKNSIGQSILAFVLHIPSKFNVLDYLWTFGAFAFYSIYQIFNPFCSGTFLFCEQRYLSKGRWF